MLTQDQVDCGLLSLEGDLSFPMPLWIQGLSGAGTNTDHPVELQTWSQQSSCSQCWTVKKSRYGWSQTSCQI
jgi:hypothetical protein